VTSKTVSITGRRFERSSGIPLKDQRGTIRCGHCGGEWGGNGSAVNLGEANRQFEEHRPECRPGFQPRSIEEIRKEVERRRREAKREKEREEEIAKIVSRVAEPKVSRSRPRKTSQPRRKSGPPSRQPNLTDEMIERMRTLYGEMGSIARVVERYYAEFGFTSRDRLRNALSKARQENGVTLGIPRYQRRLTEEMIEEAERLYEEESLSIWEISKRYHVSWGYSFKGLRNALHEIFKDAGINRKMTRRPSKMTPKRIEIAWHLYSVGNYSLREIGKISYKLWGYNPSSCQDSIGAALKGAGYKLRAKWERGPRAIEREVAIEMIKAAG